MNNKERLENIDSQRCVMESVPVDVINQLVDACIDAYIEDTGLTAAPKLKATVLAATGKTPEEIYGWDEVHGLLPKHYFVVWVCREKENKARAMYDEFSEPHISFDDAYFARTLWWIEIESDKAEFVRNIAGKE